MSAVLLAVFNDREAAERVRIDLVRDGFPTDRVELTACGIPGRADLAPGYSLHDKFAQYFRMLFTHEDEQRHADELADRVEHGAAAVTVLPRGSVETVRATEIISGAEPAEVLHQDLTNQGMEFAASGGTQPWFRHVMLESDPHADCIYCRLFERRVD